MNKLTGKRDNLFDIARKVKKFVRVIIGKDFLVEPTCSCLNERFGSNYGGWNVVSSEITSDSIIYSFGVGEDATFDIALINKYGLSVHAFDPTPKSIIWVEKQNFPDNFIMHKYGIADFDGDISFNPPDNPDHVSHTILERPKTANKSITVPVKRLTTIMKELGHNHIDLIKMDIEGAEYVVIDDLKKFNIRPRQLLIEFHHRFENGGVRKTKKAIRTIRKMRYEIFHVSDTGDEVCFIRCE